MTAENPYLTLHPTLLILALCCTTERFGPRTPTSSNERLTGPPNAGVVDKDAGHHFVTNDFAVFEDGVKTPSPIRTHQRTFQSGVAAMLPGSTINFRPQLKLATNASLMHRAGRPCGIHQCQDQKLINFSTDRNRIAYAIDLADGAGETYLYDALNYALKELEKEGKRRKAIVVLTDGLDTEMRNVDRRVVAKAQSDEEALSAIRTDASVQLTKVLNSADRQGVTIYPLALPSGDPKRLPLPGPDITGIYAAARTRLQSLAKRTGGRLTEINRLDQMAKLYREVAADLRTLYTVAYQAPADRPRDGKWHDIRVEVTHPALIARTRPGYYAR